MYLPGQYSHQPPKPQENVIYSQPLLLPTFYFLGIRGILLATALNNLLFLRDANNFLAILWPPNLNLIHYIINTHLITASERLKTIRNKGERENLLSLNILSKNHKVDTPKPHLEFLLLSILFMEPRPKLLQLIILFTEPLPENKTSL